jgi:hypothetical protein
MIGESAQEGISTLAMIDLLSRAKELRRIKNVIIRLSYIEIYNEVIKDLLISEGRVWVKQIRIWICGRIPRKAY